MTKGLLVLLAAGVALFLANYLQLVHDMRDLDAPGFNMERTLK